MDALHPRLLVGDFGAAFRFYDHVLPAVLGATLTQGGPDGPYASWDVGTEGLLMLLDRGAMAEVVGTRSLPTDPPTDPPADPPADLPVAQDRAMLVSRVPDVAAAYDVALRNGGTPVVPPADRPEWGPTMRTAHLRDPEGNLLEFQSY
jgi:catechol 2,3-dioxygenase-like lactoylglutathione lyase family enzyme